MAKKKTVPDKAKVGSKGGKWVVREAVSGRFISRGNAESHPYRKKAHPNSKTAINHVHEKAGAYGTAEKLPRAGHLIPSPAMPQKSVEIITQGLSTDVLAWLSDILGTRQREVAELINISDRTLTRRKKQGKLSFHESERALRIAQVVIAALRLFENDAEKANLWLKKSRKIFNGKSPLEYSETAPGAQFVQDVIARIEHGVFS
ncbi:MAG: antitoxin Xre-like helix-turn-helix domain-containing protein [Thermodesulfobacteriota bacterium]|nr:antitoxin Xre-like helix-turn-helix domain-containing protein [Thermodesulfobacteriota bacterium]